MEKDELKYLKKCGDSCDLYAHRTSNDIHYAEMRCKIHGFLKWLSYEQACLLPELFDDSAT